jgi:hypothetical protein
MEGIFNAGRGPSPPDVTIESILKTIDKVKRVDPMIYLVNPLLAGGMPEGLPFISSPLVPKHGQKWQFPRDPFVEYEKCDEEWAIPIGYGRWVEDADTCVVYGMYTPNPFTIRIHEIDSEDMRIVSS